MGRLDTLEEWRDIEGYEGIYQVSNLGRVRSAQVRNRDANGIRALQLLPTGYYAVQLFKDGVMRNWRVHRLVAKAFVANPKGVRIVNHIDGNKRNNNANNLEWVTTQENNAHAHKIGLFENAIATRGKSIVALDAGGNVIGKYRSISEASRTLNIDKRNISRCIRRGGKSNGLRFNLITI